MFGGLHNIVFTDYPGTAADLTFTVDDSWLKDTAVSAHVFCSSGCWKISICFAWIKNPMRLLCRHITGVYQSEEKAQLIAQHFVRTAQKDIRGQLIITKDDFNINHN